jgi:hypothetical protein
MNNDISDWHYPRLVFYYEINDKYKKKYTLSDIPPPSREYYEACLGNLMTLGRNIPTFQEFSEFYIKNKLESLNHSFKAKYVASKFSATCFGDIENFYINRSEKFYRFHEDELNNTFKIKIKPL